MSNFNRLNWDLLIYPLTAVAFGIYLIMFFVFVSTGHPVALGSYENQYLFQAKHLAETGNFVFVNPLNERYDPPIFTPYNYVQTGEKTLPFGWLGFIVLLSSFYFLHPQLVFIVTPLFGGMAVFLNYRLIRMVSNSRIAFLSSLLLATFAGFLYHSNLLSADIPAFSALLAALYFLFRDSEGNPRTNLVLAGLFFGVSISLRYPNALFAPFLLAAVVLVQADRRHVGIASFLLGLAIALTPLLYLNSMIYGDPLAVGPLNEEAVLPVPVESRGTGLSRFAFIPLDDFGVLLSVGVKYVLVFSPVLPLLAAYGFLGVRRGWSDKPQLTLLGILSGISLMLWVYYGGHRFLGATDPQPVIFSSFVRYFLPLYYTMILGAALFLDRLASNPSKIPLILVLVLYLSSNAFVAATDHNSERFGLLYLANSKIPVDAYNLEEIIIKQTPQEAVIFTKHMERLIFPYRDVATYITIPADVRIATVTRLILELLQDGIPVYFLAEDFYWAGFPAKTYFESFSASGMSVHWIDDFRPYTGYYASWWISLYRVSLSSEQHDISVSLD